MTITNFSYSTFSSEMSQGDFMFSLFFSSIFFSLLLLLIVPKQPGNKKITKIKINNNKNTFFFSLGQQKNKNEGNQKRENAACRLKKNDYFSLVPLKKSVFHQP